MRLAAGSGGAVSVLCLCLAGCSGLFHSKAKPEQIYFLRAPAAAAGGSNSPANAAARAAATTTPVSIRVVRPAAGPGLGTTHIMLVQPDHRMNFFSGSRWTAPTPEVVEALAVETLRASGAWASVEGSASPFPADYLLHIHVQRFEADYGEGGGVPVVHVVLECIVGRREGREMLATFTASGTAAAAANRLTEVVSAFEQANGTALEALARQAEQAVREDVERGAPAGSSPSASSS